MVQECKPQISDFKKADMGGIKMRNVILGVIFAVEWRGGLRKQRCEGDGWFVPVDVEL